LYVNEQLNDNTFARVNLEEGVFTVRVLDFFKLHPRPVNGQSPALGDSSDPDPVST
jgi:hypothetical protein